MQFIYNIVEICNRKKDIQTKNKFINYVSNPNNTWKITEEILI